MTSLALIYKKVPLDKPKKIPSTRYEVPVSKIPIVIPIGVTTQNMIIKLVNTFWVVCALVNEMP